MIKGSDVVLYVKASDKKSLEAIQRKLVDKLNGRKKNEVPQTQSRKPKGKKL